MKQQSFVFANADGDPIRGDVLVPSGSGVYPVIVICHGFKGFKDWGFFPHLSEQIAERGIATIRFNFSGNGIGDDLENFTELDKFERNTFSKELSDLQCVLNALDGGDLPEARCLDTGRTGLLGHSRGGAIALLTAAADPRIKALVTWSSVPTLLWYVDQHEQWRADGFLTIVNARTGQEMKLGLDMLDDMTQNREALNVLNHAADISAPTLVVHGADDATVPVDAARMLHEKIGAERRELCLIDGAGHTFEAVYPFTGSTPQLDRAIQATGDWFAFLRD